MTLANLKTFVTSLLTLGMIASVGTACASHTHTPQTSATPHTTVDESAPEIVRFQTLLTQKSFDRAEQQLKHLERTPLSEYAQFLWLNASPNMTQFPQLITYLSDHPNTGWSEKLKQTWAEFLANHKQWQTLRQYAGLFDKGDAQCWTWQSYLNTNEQPNDDWYSAVKAHWQTQVKPTKTCQVVHRHLTHSDHISPNDWTARVYFALSQTPKGETLVHDWLVDMSPAQAQTINQLLTSLSQPDIALNNIINTLSRTLHNKDNTANTTSERQQPLLLLRKLSLSDPKAAYQYWQKLTELVTIHPLIQAPFERHLFWQLSKKDPDHAVSWLQKIPANQHDETSLTPIFNQAWQTNDWSLLLNTLNLLPTTQIEQDRWQYWKAKALQQLGQTEQAQPILESLARQRSFYGFLAADIIGQRYQLNAKYVAPEDSNRVMNNPFLQQLQALYTANLKDVAWREWRYRVAHGDITLTEIPAFAQEALKWGWTDFSVLSMGNPQHWDYVSLRFPMPYRQLLETNSQQYQIPLAWAYAITRRESAYNAGVTSHSGAIGLMQLMPKTAKNVATALGTKIKHKQEIYHPDLNVKLGTKHLSQLITTFDHYLLATAAYNAGGARVKQWLARYPNVATDQWVELIPFKETRDYVKAVLEYWLVFEQLGGLPNTQLAQYMMPLPQKTPESSSTAVASLQPESTEAQSAQTEKSSDDTAQSSGLHIPFFDFF